MGLDLAGRSDVRQVRYEITPVDCASGESAGSLIVSERQVSGAVPSLESVGSDRVMAHAFTQLPTGCYDVTATPLTHRGEASAVCASASEALIEVQRGATTSVALVSHCSPHVRAFGEHALATSEG